MAVISISRQYGAGGTDVGRQVAEELGYRFFDRALLALLAQESGLYLDGLAELEERAQSRWLDRLSRAFPGYTEAVFGRGAENGARDTGVAQVISRLEQVGSAVIVGQASQFVLSRQPHVVRVLLVASEEKRIASLQERYSISRQEAESVAGEMERCRMRYLKAYKAGHPLDPLLYSLTLNTGEMGLDQAAEIIVRLVRGMKKAVPS